MTEIISLANQDIQEAILRLSACPIPKDEFTEKLIKDGFIPDKLFEINITWLLKSGELISGTDFYLASGNHPHQLTLPVFESLITQHA